MKSLEHALEGGGRIVADRFGNPGDAAMRVTQLPHGEQQAPTREIVHGRFAENGTEPRGERRTRSGSLGRKFGDGPRPAWIGMQQGECATD